MRTPSFLAVLLLASTASLATSSVARAQHTAGVAVAQLTVDDQAPPGQYRELLATGLQPTLQPVMQCYLDRLAQIPGTQGTLRLRLWVSAREVIRATEEESSVDDDTFDECVRAAVRTFRLPDAAPAGGATVRLTLYFRRNGLAAPALQYPADVFASTEAAIPARSIAPVMTAPPRVEVTVPAPAAPEPRASLTVDRVRGGLDADAILAGIPPTSFDACPAGTGDRVLTLSISRTGVVRATAGRGTLRQRDLFNCVMRTVRAVRMPAARPATTATVTLSLSR